MSYLYKQIRILLHYIGIHWMKFHHDTGHNEYYECRICKIRKVWLPNSGYQPIDRDWLTHKINYDA